MAKVDRLSVSAGCFDSELIIAGDAGAAELGEDELYRVDVHRELILLEITGNLDETHVRLSRKVFVVNDRKAGVDGRVAEIRLLNPP